MHFISTRGGAPRASFSDVLLAGLAPDGGLYLPESWPQLSAAEIAAFAGKPYQEVAYAILSRFTAGSFTLDELKADIQAAYAGFDAPAIAPLRAIAPERQPVSAGAVPRPTFAFKDIALADPGPAFLPAPWRAAAAAPRLSPPPAAIPARPPSPRWVGSPISKSSSCIRKGRVSDVQRLQMTTSAHGNVHNIALEGSFDDAQGIVKELFAHTEFAGTDRTDRGQFHQLCPHRGASRLLLHRHGAAGQARHFRGAHRQFRRHLRRRSGERMGLAADRLVIATNANDIMARALNDGVYASGQSTPPSARPWTSRWRPTSSAPCSKPRVAMAAGWPPP